MHIDQLVLASTNEGKLREFKLLLKDNINNITSIANYSQEVPAEPHATFVENAIVKARFASEVAKLPALADDSGICVNYLNGKPGVKSARFSSSGDDEDNNKLLLEKLNNVSDRSAYYYCSLVLFRYPNDPSPIITQGKWEGSIATSPKGENGFGYDPLFLLANGKTAAEISKEEKNKISHRAMAINALINLLA